MNRIFGAVAFFSGLAAIGWVAWGYLGSNPLALSMSLLIGVVYLIGALELLRFNKDTTGLSSALSSLPGSLTRLTDWLDAVPANLRNPVRLRIEGERVGLPGPVMTPYLVGLLVLLGMLGTFLGMVVTLNGAVMALQSTTDLPTMRAALAAPVKGLGLAFGTSVAGVAASAMLGLVSALCRRERLLAAQHLDSHIATGLRGFSLAHQREQTLSTLQLQAGLLPEVVQTMQTMMLQMREHNEGLNLRLLADQERFHQHAQTAYTDLARSVDVSLRQSLSESAHSAGATIQPMVEATMAAMARETALFQQQMANSVQQQLDGLTSRFDDSMASVAQVWTGSLAKHEQSSDMLTATLQKSLSSWLANSEQQSAALLRGVDTAHAGLLAHAQASDEQRLSAWTGALQSMAASLHDDAQRSSAATLAQHDQICQTLAQTAREIQTQAGSQARETISEMSRLIDVAEQAPRAAAEVVSSLREKLSDSMTRDNQLLEERSRIMASLSTLLDAVNQTAADQRSAIESLIDSSTTLFQQTGSRFNETIEVESAKMATSASQVSASVIEAASMGEAFGVAVQLFSDSNESLTSHLQRIEAALSKSTARSDEQLAYFVAQAREIVDLSISSQKQIVDDLQQLSPRRERPLLDEAA